MREELHQHGIGLQTDLITQVVGEATITSSHYTAQWCLASERFFHDGSAVSLEPWSHYNTVLPLGLTVEEKATLVEYLKSF